MSNESDENDEIVYAPDSEEIKTEGSWKILIVDDDKIMHGPTIRTMQREIFLNKTIKFLSAYNSKEAKKILEKHDDIAVILLDVVMENPEAGLELIGYLRNQLKNSYTQIILRTGQPGYAPEEETIKKYQICNYLGKAEISALRLKTSVILAIRAFEYSLNLEEKILKTNGKIEDQANKLLKMKNEKQVLIRTLFHDFANPTAEIKSACYKIDLKNPENSTEFLEKVKIATKKQTDLISSAHLEQVKKDGKFDFKLQAYRISDLVINLEAIFAEKFLAKDICFTSQFDPNLEVFVDPFTFEAVVMAKLITKTIELNPKGSKIGLVINMMDHNKVEILVNWDSSEIPREMIDILENPSIDISKLEADKKLNPDLEMSLIKSYIEAYGGTIGVYQEKNKSPELDNPGSQFRILLDAVVKVAVA